MLLSLLAFEKPLYIIVGFIWGIFVHHWLLRATEKTVGTLVLDKDDSGDTQGYITFSKDELHSIPKSGYIRLRISHTSRKKNNGLNE